MSLIEFALLDAYERGVAAGRAEERTLDEQATPKTWAPDEALEERAAIVKWLRCHSEPEFVAYGDDPGFPAPGDLADAIERGDHLK